MLKTDSGLTQPSPLTQCLDQSLTLPAALPLAQMGVSVNSTAYSAKLMTAMAFDPKLIAPMLFGDTDATHAYVQDGAALACPGEHLNWWQLMVRRDRAVESS